VGPLKPRAYQEEAAQLVFAEWDQALRVVDGQTQVLDEQRLNALIVWATGLGKTFEFSYIGRQLREQGVCRRILVLAHRTELIQQAKDKWLKVDPGELLGIYQAQKRETWANVICGSVQSCYPDVYRRHACPACQPMPEPDPFCDRCDGDGLEAEPGCSKCQRRRPKPTPDCVSCNGEGGEEYLHRRGRIHDLPLAEIDLIVIDEVHHVFRESLYTRIVDAVRDVNPACRLLGVTATPFRTDRRGLGWLFDRSVHTISIKRGIEMGYLVPLRGVRVELEVDLSGVRVSKSSGDFVDEDLGKVMDTEEAREQVVEAWRKHAGPGAEGAGAEGRLTAAFCPTVASAKHLCESFNAAGVAAGWICGDKSIFPDKKRKAVLDSLARKEIRVLVNVGVLTEGWDEPEVSCILLVRPTKSKGLLIQMVGRGTRLLGPPLEDAEDLRIESSVANGKSDCLVIDCTGATSLGLASVADLTNDDEKDEKEQSDADPDEGPPELEFPEEPSTVRVTGFCSYSFDVFSCSIHWQQVNGARVAGLGAGRSVVIFDRDGRFTVVCAGLRSGVEFICRDEVETVALEEAEIYALENGEPSYLKPDNGLSKIRASEKQKAYIKKLLAWHRDQIGSMPMSFAEINRLSMARASAWVAYIEARLAFHRRFANGHRSAAAGAPA